jgi:hypothetical protein
VKKVNINGGEVTMLAQCAAGSSEIHGPGLNEHLLSYKRRYLFFLLGSINKIPKSY